MPGGRTRRRQQLAEKQYTIVCDINQRSFKNKEMVNKGNHNKGENRKCRFPVDLAIWKSLRLMVGNHPSESSHFEAKCIYY